MVDGFETFVSSANIIGAYLASTGKARGRDNKIFGMLFYQEK